MAQQPTPKKAEPVDITLVELALIERKVRDADGLRNVLTDLELKALHQHELFVRFKRIKDDAAAATKAADELPKRNAALFTAKVAGLVSARNKAGLASLIVDLENCQRLRDVRATKGDETIKKELAQHQERVSRLKAALQKSNKDALMLTERIAEATAALQGIDNAFKCPNCGIRLPTKRNLDQHLLKCKPKTAAPAQKPAPAPKEKKK